MAAPWAAPPVLVVEDDPTVARLLAGALGAARIANPVETYADGNAAMDRLRSAAGGESRIPVLVLLDLYLPGAGGLELLTFIRAQSRLAAVPVVMLSRSEEEREIERSYQLGASTYLVKPAGIHALADVVVGLGLQSLLLPAAGPVPE